MSLQLGSRHVRVRAARAIQLAGPRRRTMMPRRTVWCVRLAIMALPSLPTLVDVPHVQWEIPPQARGRQQRVLAVSAMWAITERQSLQTLVDVQHAIQVILPPRRVRLLRRVVPCVMWATTVQ